MRFFLAAGFCATAQASLTANEIGAAQEMKESKMASKDVCDGRSSSCSVLLDVPAACAGSTSTCPVVFMLHGHGGRNVGFNNKDVHDYNFIGIYPQGETYEGASGWNDGSMKGLRCAYNDYTCTKDPNDGIFFAGIIAAVKEMGATGRVYGYGGSNGANEMQILASNACDKLPFVAIAAHAGQLLQSPARSAGAPYDYNQPCAGSQPCKGGNKVAQLSIHGDADGVIPYDGGSRFESDVFLLMPEGDSDKIWAEQNGCTGTLSQSTVTAKANGGQVTTAIHYVWGGCPADAPVEYYKVAGALHVATSDLNDKSLVNVVYDFFTGVEKAHIANEPFQQSIVV